MEKAGRGGNMKLSASVAQLPRSKGEKKAKTNGRQNLNSTKQSEGMTGEGRLKASRGQLPGQKKAHDTQRNGSGLHGHVSEQQMGSIAREAAQQLL